MTLNNGSGEALSSPFSSSVFDNGSGVYFSKVSVYEETSRWYLSSSEELPVFGSSLTGVPSVGVPSVSVFR